MFYHILRCPSIPLCGYYFFSQFSIPCYGLDVIIKNHLVRIYYYSTRHHQTTAFLKITMCLTNCDSNFLLTLLDRLEYKNSLSLWHVFLHSVRTENLTSIVELFAKIVRHLAALNRFFQAGIYLLKVNNEHTKTRCEKIKVVTLCSSVSIVNFERANTGWVTYASNMSNSLVLEPNINDKTH